MTSLREIAVGEVYQVRKDDGDYLAEADELQIPKELPGQSEDASSGEDKDDQEGKPEES